MTILSRVLETSLRESLSSVCAVPTGSTPFGHLSLPREVFGKVTFVHKRLQPAVAAVGRAREPWQMRGLSPAARRLLARVDRDGSVNATGAASKELQERLLVNAHEEHTESGRHETVLEPWPKSKLTPEAGRHQIEKTATAIGAELHDLPWNRFAVT